MVSASILAMQLLPLQATHRLPSALTLMPVEGRDFGVGIVSRASIFAAHAPPEIRRPTMLLTCKVGPQGPALVEDGRMRVASGRVRHGVLDAHAGARIEFADGAVAVARVPDVTFPIGRHAVGLCLCR